jgi:DNA-binding response OmpR family regulator
MFATENVEFDAVATPLDETVSDDGSLLANAALGIGIEHMNIVVVDPSRTMQTILRSMLQQMRPKRLRVYDSAVAALRDMVVEPPNLVLTEWKMDHMSGYGLIKIMRHHSMAPLCAIPVIVITGSATRSIVEAALRIGAHAVLAKPLSPAILRQRIDWITRDDRPLVRLDSQYVIDGVDTALDIQRAKDRLPSIIQQIRTAEGAPLAAAASEGDKNSPATTGRLTPLGQADKARIIKRLERSPTLDRLLRQRVKVLAESDERARAAQQTSGEKVELKSAKRKTGGLSRWKEIWGG